MLNQPRRTEARKIALVRYIVDSTIYVEDSLRSPESSVCNLTASLFSISFVFVPPVNDFCCHGSISQSLSIFVCIYDRRTHKAKFRNLGASDVSTQLRELSANDKFQYNDLFSVKCK